MKMKKAIVAARVQGFSHRIDRKPCQDYYATNVRKGSNHCKDIRNLCDVYAVADGHGADIHALSKEGSELATLAFRNVVGGLLKQFTDLASFREYLTRESVNIAKAIDGEWKALVWKRYKKTHFMDPNVEEMKKESAYILYGTTLLGAVVSSEFIWVLQIGDGNISLVTGEESTLLFEDDGLVGSQTYSLCMDRAYLKVKQRMIQTPSEPFMLALSTDGFYNSYETEEDYLITVKAYFDEIILHGRKATQKKLKTWLDETSHYGSGDDITLVLATYGV